MAEEQKSGLDAIRKKFESGQAPIMGFKPPVASSKPAVVASSKPALAARFGGGINNACNGSVAKESHVKVGSAIVNSRNDDVQKRDSGGTADRGIGPKRNSKVNIPDAFRSNAEPPVAIKPKPVPTPKPKSDSNNNASTPDKFSLQKVKFGQKSEPESTNTVKPSILKGNISKTTDTNNESEKPGVGAKPNSPRGINVLAMANSMQANDLKAKLKPVTPPKKPSGSSGSETDQVALRNKFNKFGNRTSEERKSVKSSVIRKLDGKKFHRVDPSALKNSGKAPEKPEELDFEIDLEVLIEDFNKAVEAIGKSYQNDILVIVRSKLCQFENNQ